MLFLQDLTGLSELVLELHQQQQLTWLGGVTNHEDIFQPLYRMLLALHITASSQMVLDNLPSMPKHLQRARDCLQQVDLNPVLAALLLSTINQWKEETGQHQVSYSLFSCKAECMQHVPTRQCVYEMIVIVLFVLLCVQNLCSSAVTK